MRKQITSLLLSLLMLLTLLPTAAWAEDTVHSGTCGDNLDWTLENGVLTITGTGGMDDYIPQYVPWYSYRSDVKSLVLDSRITHIGRYAFDHCSNLTEVKSSASYFSVSSFGSTDTFLTVRRSAAILRFRPVSKPLEAAHLKKPQYPVFVCRPLWSRSAPMRFITAAASQTFSFSEQPTNGAQ